MRNIMTSIEAEYRRYKALAEGAMAQLAESDLSRPPANGSNAIAVIVWHVSGNLSSRFTELLTADGEKPWRKREEEFEPRTVTRQELLEKWERGWSVLLGALAGLNDADMTRIVTIRGQGLAVYDALHRSLAHTSYHVGQIVYVAKAFREQAWSFLSIPPGGSDAYNRNPAHEKPAAHAAALRDKKPTV
jgi:hypothetical protein